MNDYDNSPGEEMMHFMKCPECGEYFYISDRTHVLNHQHQSKRRKPIWTSLRKIGSPEEHLIGKYLTTINLN